MIDGTLNLADLLTKQHCLGTEDVSGGSVWQEGNPWMKMDVDKMPLKKYSDLTIPSSLEKQVSEECYDHLLLPREDSEFT